MTKLWTHGTGPSSHAHTSQNHSILIIYIRGGWPNAFSQQCCKCFLCRHLAEFWIRIGSKCIKDPAQMGPFSSLAESFPVFLPFLVVKLNVRSKLGLFYINLHDVVQFKLLSAPGRQLSGGQLCSKPYSKTLILTH